MKYGKNQWARISSLLVRKSPKQCKQRWYEWLDPSIKKTPWTREEEEKLLHLAKIMPTQWRTIAASIEGRTASQCLQHYEKLLDQAQGKDAMDPSDDPRRLRPGEIDPNPEVKPALPDPVDFDEDEKEMLQEARARLANTQGKKAKRRAREKTLDEAKRLAALQKRRELKAAGIHVSVPQQGTKKKRTKMADVVSERSVPAGFYDTTKEDEREESLRRNPRFQQITLQKLEGRRQEDEEKLRKKDNEKMKRLKEDNLPAAMAKISKANDPMNVSARPAFNLPAPQISNTEIEQIVKVTQRNALEDGDGNSVTAALLPRVEQTPSITPMRTPLTASGGGDAVMREAQQLALMNRETQTPLVGGASHASELGAVKREITTPNVLKTPLVGSKTGSRNVMQTPTGAAAAAATASSDSFAVPESKKRRVNEGEEVVVAGDDLFANLASLPAPKNASSKIVVPIIVDEDGDVEGRKDSNIEPDAGEVARHELAVKEEIARSTDALLSSVLRLGLPRPQMVGNVNLSGPFGSLAVQLIAHDNSKYIIESSSKDKKKRRTRPDESSSDVSVDHPAPVTERELENARKEIAKDMESVDLNAFIDMWDEWYASTINVPGRGRIPKSDCSVKEQCAALKAQHEGLVAAIEEKSKQCQKIESKIKILHQGYIDRCSNIGASISSTYDALQKSLYDRECFRMLLASEQEVIPHRIAKLEAEVAEIAQVEASLQRDYAEMMSRRL